MKVPNISTHWHLSLACSLGLMWMLSLAVRRFCRIKLELLSVWSDGPTSLTHTHTGLMFFSAFLCHMTDYSPTG